MGDPPPARTRVPSQHLPGSSAGLLAAAGVTMLPALHAGLAVFDHSVTVLQSRLAGPGGGLANTGAGGAAQPCLHTHYSGVAGEHP